LLIMNICSRIVH